MGKRSFGLAFIAYLLVISLLGFFLSREFSPKKAENKEISIKKENILLRVSGNKVEKPNKEKIVFKGIALPNGVYNVVYPCKLFGSSYELKDDDYSRIATLGMNSVRFYLQYTWLKDEDKTDFFEYLDKQIVLAKKYGIYLIINLHYFGEASNVKRGLDDGFYKGNPKYDLNNFWKKISDRYKDEPTIAAYDLLNEPSTSRRLSEEKLYEKYNEIISTLRENGDEHIIIVSDPVNKFSKELKKDTNKSSPFNKLRDKNIVYQFHWYEPIEFTHQGFFESEYFELGADYPTEKKLDDYKGGFYKSPYIAETNGAWVEYKTPWVDFDNANCTINSQVDRFNLSLSFSGLKGKVWFDDISLYKKDINGRVVRLLVPNSDISNSRSFVGWIRNPKASNMPARWNAMNDPKTSGIEYKIDWENDHTDNGSGSLYANGAKSKWGKNNAWAVWGQSGGSLSTYYPIDTDATYQARFWVKTENNPAYTVSVGFGVYALKEFLLNKFTMQNMIHEYYTNWAKRYNVPLYCGEFGTTNPGLLNQSFMSNQQEDWVRDMKGILNEEVGNWSYHSYKSYSPRSDLFGLYNDKEDKQIIRILRNK